MSQQKILFLTGDYAEDYETMVPFQMMQMIGHTIHAVCPDKSAGDKIITAIHDFEGDQTYSEKRGHYFVLNASFSDVQVSSYDALMIAGGRAPEYLRLNAKVIDMVKQFVAAGKPIAAICHGIQILTAADAVRGRTLTAYPAVAPEVTLAGGNYAAVNIDEAVTDGNLVTAPAWPAHPQWVAAFLKVLGTSIQL
ncbi:DJ-1/PfpI family protein [Chitinophaga filiformis]|uniref:Protease I n=1 Tax=Chitinophaga filiformis TaxID=104663 RepID=A0A1G7HD73_CHIFI|nr:DJ-1/PfpI family protein [Chitinophaga filiformis]SDE98328.1 protease I [Chitinophaga filiformis]